MPAQWNLTCLHFLCSSNVLLILLLLITAAVISSDGRRLQNTAWEHCMPPVTDSPYSKLPITFQLDKKCYPQFTDEFKGTISPKMI